MSIVQQTKYNETIVALLDRPEFPPIVALDGPWGIGKTHFINEHLITYIKNVKRNKVFYVSLTGVDSLQTFKDKLISNAHFGKEENKSILESFFDSTLQVAAKMGDSEDKAAASAASAILSKSSGVIKEKMVNGIKDTYIILDDIERLHKENLASQILGQCLDMSLDKQRNVKFIVATCTKALKLKEGEAEKYFSGKVHYNTNKSEIMEIAFSKFGFYNDFRDVILKTLNEVNVNNIRSLVGLCAHISQQADDVRHARIENFPILSG